jgi:hypothetical protein
MKLSLQLKERMWQRSKLKTVLVVQSERDIFSDNQGNHHIYNTHSTTEGFSNQAPPLNYLLYTGSYCSMIVVNGISRTLHDDRRTIKKRRAKAVEPRPKLLHRSIRLLLPAARHQMGSRCHTDWLQIARRGQFVLVPCGSAAAYR